MAGKFIDLGKMPRFTEQPEASEKHFPRAHLRIKVPGLDKMQGVFRW